MARIKLDMPDSYCFTCEIAVRISDMNYGNHLSNDVYLAIMHEARMQFLKHYSFTEMDIAGASFIMADSAIVYKKEVFYGDKIRIQVQPAEWWARGVDLFYRFSDAESGDLIAEAKTGMVFFDYSTRKTRAYPNEFYDLFNR